MPTTPHVEKHFTASEAVRDIVIGMSDSLTAPFALAAGLTGATVSSSIIVTAGLAEEKIQPVAAATASDRRPRADGCADKIETAPASARPDAS
jgi:vacuolar iron transporter family protein